MFSISPISETPLAYRQHTIREFSSWKSIVEETAKWVNSNIHAARVVSIAMVYCHTTGAGQAAIYYNAAKDDILESKIKQLCEYGLHYVIMDTYSSWSSQHDKTMQNMEKISQLGGRVISVCELEVNNEHNRALTVIWYMKKY